MKGVTAFHTLGNKGLLGLTKVAFLCSRHCPEATILKSLAWAVAQREKGACVISGCQSPIEKDVFRLLLAGSQPVILALARGVGKRLEPGLQAALDADRLLIVTRYAKSVTHACEQSCFQRNRLMLELAEEAVIGYASPGGSLQRLCRESPGIGISLL